MSLQEVWSSAQEGAALERIMVAKKLSPMRMNTMMGLAPSNSGIYRHLRGAARITPFAAERYAQVLGCNVSDFCPRLTNGATSVVMQERTPKKRKKRTVLAVNNMGELLKSLMLERGLSPRELNKRMGLGDSDASVYAHLRNERGITMRAVMRYAQALGVEPTVFTSATQQHSQPPEPIQYPSKTGGNTRNEYVQWTEFFHSFVPQRLWPKENEPVKGRVQNDSMEPLDLTKEEKEIIRMLRSLPSDSQEEIFLLFYSWSSDIQVKEREFDKIKEQFEVAKDFAMRTNDLVKYREACERFWQVSQFVNSCEERVNQQIMEFTAKHQ